MAKRRKPEKPPPISVDWQQYKPWEPRYWMFGGPYVEPDAIEPQRKPGSDIGPGYKPPARRKWAFRCKEEAERYLKESTARYVGAKTHGMKGISPPIREHWEARVHSCSVLPGRDPSPVDDALAYGYRDIRYQKGMILACDAAIDEIDRANHPLLHGRD